MDKEKIQDAIDLLEEALKDGEEKDYSVEEKAAIEAAQTLKKWCKRRNGNCSGCVFSKSWGKNKKCNHCELNFWTPEGWDI
jgi:hypothetical protein